MKPRLRLIAGERRAEVERRLRALGLLERTRTSEEVPPDAEDIARRIHRAAAQLGPAFIGFAHYLATRPDVVPAPACLELARAPLPPEIPVARVRRELEVALGAGEVAEVEPGARFRGPFHQSHRGRLADGRRVWLVLRRPELPEAVERDLDILELLEPALLEMGAAAGEAFAGYRRSLDTDLDLSYTADALERLSHHVAATDFLAVARVDTELSGSRVVVLDDPGGEPLDSLADLPFGRGRAQELARRLSLVWLERALVGGLVPVEAEVVELADGRLSFVGGRFAELPSSSQTNLWAYLQATAAFHPDRAGTCLLRELRRGPRADERELHLKLRQVVPFRDGSWSPHGDRLAEHLMIHWRLARECGYRVPQHLESLYRGLFWLARTSGAISADADALRQAQEELRWLAAWVQFREMVQPRQVAYTLEDNLGHLLELPQKIDRVLRLVEGEGPGLRVRRETAETPAERKRRNRRTVAVSLGLVMMAAALAGPRLAEIASASGWPRPEWASSLAPAVFLIFGALLLWVLGKGR